MQAAGFSSTINADVTRRWDMKGTSPNAFRSGQEIARVEKLSNNVSYEAHSYTVSLLNTRRCRALI